jgi:hypothetical protein
MARTDGCAAGSTCCREATPLIEDVCQFDRRADYAKPHIGSEMKMGDRMHHVSQRWHAGRDGTHYVMQCLLIDSDHGSVL